MRACEYTRDLLLQSKIFNHPVDISTRRALEERTHQTLSSSSWVRSSRSSASAMVKSLHTRCDTVADRARPDVMPSRTRSRSSPA